MSRLGVICSLMSDEHGMGDLFKLDNYFGAFFG